MLSASTGSANDLRATARSNVFLAATLLAAGESIPVRVRNISSCGVLIDSGSLPGVGSPVQLRRGSLSADGEIAWQSGGHYGVRFHLEVDVEEWVRQVGNAGQQRVDRIVTLLRQPPFPDAASLVLASSVDSLDAISAGLTAICERLANSSAMVTDHPEDLLRLDAIAQRLRRALEARRETAT